MLSQVAQRLHHSGVTANTVTLTGFLLMLPAAYFIIRGQLLLAAITMALSGFMDLLDGRIARIDEKRSPFGALLDSFMDRYGDAIHLIAIAIYFMHGGDIFFMILAVSALIGSFQISYVKARAEGLHYGSRVGFWQRPERFAMVIAALLVDNLGLAILYLGVLTHVTAFERLFHVSEDMEGPEPRTGAVRESHAARWARLIFFHDGNRQSRNYRVKALLFILSLIFIRVG